MLKRIRNAFLLGIVGISWLVLSVYIGVLAGLTWLKPAAEALGNIFDQFNVGVFLAAGAALVGLGCLWLAFRALFKRSRPKKQ